MTATTAAGSRGVSARLRDLALLTKPRITMLVVITAAGGLWLAPAAVAPSTALVTLLAIAAVVSAANAFNCWLERDVDAFMERTRNRPLPAHRLEPRTALTFAIVLGALSVPVLTFAANPLTGLLAAIALVTYVWIYTPLKLRSPEAVLVGAIPGALPPLMGYTAATGAMDATGLALFGILFFWQLPHFIAISIYRREEYERAGIRVIPSVRGELAAKVQAIVYTVALVATTIVLVPLGVAGPAYLATAVILGAVFLGYGVMGLRARDTRAWARRSFLLSLVYLTLLFAALMIDAR